MILGLRTDSADSEVLVADGRGEVKVQKKWTSGRKLAEELLATIEDMVHEQGQDWSNLTGIVVYEGPGSFTGLRIGITVANAITYKQKIKVAAATGEDWFKSGVTMLANGQAKDIAMPAYGGEANITKPKK